MRFTHFWVESASRPLLAIAKKKAGQNEVRPFLSGMELRLAPFAAFFAMAAAIAAAHRRAIFARTRDIDCEGPALKWLIVEHFDHLVGFVGRGILDECEAA